MADDQEQEPDRPGRAGEEADKVAQSKAGSPRVLHEVMRQEGEEELGRPAMSLLFSGLAAGVAITASVITQAILTVRLPQAPWTSLIVSLGYTVGFLIVIMGRMQLFTESTVTPVLPVAVRPSVGNMLRLLRLWGLVLGANLTGSLIVAVMMRHDVLMDPEYGAAMLGLSRKLLGHDPATLLLHGIPAGFLIASVAWLLPNARGSEFWVILLVTWLIGAGEFTHVVAGSSEAWLLWLTGDVSFAGAVGGLILPALAGNVIGGTLLFAVLAHGQVYSEL